MPVETALSVATSQSGMHLSYRSPSKDLKEVLLQQEAEAHELRQVIAMKDGIIRSLGEKLGMAEAASDVICMKDEVIRQLQADLEELRAQGSSKDPEVMGVNNGTVGTAVPFTALPIPPQAYVPCDRAVDRCIADFSNSRRNLVLFTRLEADDYYLYGRMLVRCYLDEADEQVLVQVEGHGIFSLQDFVRLFEETEHAELDRHFLEATGILNGGLEPMTTGASH